MPDEPAAVLRHERDGQVAVGPEGIDQPGLAEARQRQRGLLLRLGRGLEARVAWKKDLAARPARHDDWFGYAELCLFLGDEAEYRRARRDLLTQFGTATAPEVAERVGRACLLRPAPADELRPAAPLAERAAAAARPIPPFVPYCLFAEGLARYRQGRLDDAIKLMTARVVRSQSLS
jgi:serine/threonine-protein kinase